MFHRIPDSPEKEKVKQEIIENLEEKVFDLIAQGKSEEDAINKAIVEFGDIEEIRQELGSERHVIDHVDEGDTLYRSIQMAKLNLGYSLCGSALLIGLFLFINFYYTPHVIWFVYPTFGILWWPLSMFYQLLRKKSQVFDDE
nr:permease prefix domain 1-containing protein [Halalkalibacter oceani]